MFKSECLTQGILSLSSRYSAKRCNEMKKRKEKREREIPSHKHKNTQTAIGLAVPSHWSFFSSSSVTKTSISLSTSAPGERRGELRLSGCAKVWRPRGLSPRRDWLPAARLFPHKLQPWRHARSAPPKLFDPHSSLDDDLMSINKTTAAQLLTR